jgi:pimeloyl-ACP methyl ester carboxylesterase
LLLHGYGHGAFVWEEIAQYLEDDFRLYALDFRGHGESAWDPQGRYEIDRLVADVVAAAQALALERPIVVGHSMGAEVALRYCALYPDRVERLVLIDHGPEAAIAGLRVVQQNAESANREFHAVEEYADLLRELYPLASAARVVRLARESSRRGAGGSLVPRMDPAFSRVARGRIAKADERGRVSNAILWRLLGEFTCPTLVVRGAASSVLAADVAERMARSCLVNGRVQTVPRAGHGVMIDNPEGMLAAMAPFLYDGSADTMSGGQLQ